VEEQDPPASPAEEESDAGDAETGGTCGRAYEHEDEDQQCGPGCAEYDAGEEETREEREAAQEGVVEEYDGDYVCSVCGENEETCEEAIMQCAGCEKYFCVGCDPGEIREDPRADGAWCDNCEPDAAWFAR